MDMFIYQKSLQYGFTQRELSLCQWRWLDLLKVFDTSVYYHPGKANVVADALRMLSMGRTTHVDNGKELVNDVHRLARLDVRLMVSSSGSSSQY